MDYSRTFAISAAGMAAERLRVETAALNLANAHTVQGPDGPGYQPVRVVARSVELTAASFPDQVVQGLDELATSRLTVPVATVEPTLVPSRVVHDPSHPLADEHGNLAYPGVDTATEMVSLMSAMRAYEASVAAMNTTRALVLKTLEIGGGT